MAVDLSFYGRQKSLIDMKQLQAEFDLKKALLSAKTENGGGATLAAAKKLMQADPTLDFTTAFSIAKSGLGQGNTRSDGTVVNMAGAPQAFSNIENAKQTGKNSSDLEFAFPQADQTALGKAAGERTADKTSKIQANEVVLPEIAKLREINNSSPTLAYANLMQPFRKAYPGTSDKEKAVDLMEQQRINMAAPLAKMLGVNPTDRDFEATMKSIFDISSTKESRAAQIDALEGKILRNNSVLSGQVNGNPTQDPMQEFQGAIEQRQLENGVSPAQRPDLAKATTQYKEGQKAFNAQTNETLVFTNGQWVKAK